jgi:hypothetical protein
MTEDGGRRSEIRGQSSEIRKNSWSGIFVNFVLFVVKTLGSSVLATTKRTKDTKVGWALQMTDGGRRRTVLRGQRSGLRNQLLADENCLTFLGQSDHSGDFRHQR